MVTYLVDRTVTPSTSPKASVEHDAGMVGDESVTAEVVLDNSKFLVNCFEEAPPGDLVFDLGYRDVTLSWTPFTTHFNGLADPDTSTEMVIPSGSHSSWSNGYWAQEDHVGGGYPNMIYLPDVPDGYELIHAQYVVIAYREFANDPPDPAFAWSDAYGPPTEFPFLYIDSAGTSDYHSFYPLPIGDYDGETISDPDSELLSRIVETGSTAHARMWLGRGHFPDAISPIHLAYFALRLTYSNA